MDIIMKVMFSDIVSTTGCDQYLYGRLKTSANTTACNRGYIQLTLAGNAGDGTHAWNLSYGKLHRHRNINNNNPGDK